MTPTETFDCNGSAKASFAASGCYASLPPVLDVCCGPRMMWFDHRDPRALFVDRRREHHVIDKGTPGTIGRKDAVIDPDVLADFSDLPFPDGSFSLVVMDPPHLRRLEARGTVTKKYGVLIPGWEENLRAGFAECFRVLKPNGVFIFKWCEIEVPLERVLALTDQKPLFGHRSGAKAQTHWCAFLKHNAPGERPANRRHPITQDFMKQSETLNAGSLDPVVIPRWHDATKETPEWRQRVLVRQKNGVILVGWRAMNQWKKEQWVCGYSKLYGDQVTHWCEIPPLTQAV